MMGAVGWGALVTGVVLAAGAVALVVWRRRRIEDMEAAGPELDLVSAEADALAEDREFDRIIGHLLMTDPGFADSASRLARHDDNGPAI